MQRAFRAVLVASLLGAAGFLAYAAAVRSFGFLEARGRLMMSLVGLAIGAWLAEIDARGFEKFRIAAVAGLAGIVVSQVCYLALVWTEWIVASSLWRAWWTSMVVSVTAAHIVGLRLASEDRRGFWDRWTPWLAAAAGALWFGLALRPKIGARPDPLYLYMLAVPAVLTVVGSIVVWRVWARNRPASEPASAVMRRSWQVAGMAALFFAGFYVGRVTVEPPSFLDAPPSPLASMTRDEIEAQVRADLGRLKIVTEGVEAQAKRLEALERELSTKRAAEHRDVFEPAEEDRLRAEFMTFLAYRAALLRMVAMYAGFESAGEPELKARCFTVGFGAGAAALASSLSLVRTFRDDEAARRKLDEPHPDFGLRGKALEAIYANVTSDRTGELFEEMNAYYESRHEEWRASGVWPDADFRWLEGLIGRSVAAVRAKAVHRNKLVAAAERFVKRVKEDTYTPAYAAQSVISTWIGDTRISSRPPMISHEQILGLQKKLKPGDILLERRNWFLSNAFLPGFWPHAALYVGTEADLKRLGIAEDPAVKSRLARFRAPAPDGGARTVIESVSEGVIFNSLTESMHADFVAALRPRLSDAQIAKAIVNAFRHEGRPYDFEFDFFTDDKLVCTELVYRSYQGLLNFQLVHVMGRDTLPALEFVKKFRRERGAATRELDFVLFLDGDAATGRAREADEEAFCGSADRPQEFNE